MGRSLGSAMMDQHIAMTVPLILDGTISMAKYNTSLTLTESPLETHCDRTREKVPVLRERTQHLAYQIQHHGTALFPRKNCCPGKV